MKKAKTILTEQTFEARYERGYRYLDKTGDAMLVLEDLLSADTGKLWMPEEMQPKGAHLKCPALDMSIYFDTYRAVVIQKPADVDCDLGRIAASLLATLSGRFDLRSFIRFGGRRIHMLGMDSLEEAEVEAAKLSPVGQWPLSEGLKTTGCQVVSVQESEDRLMGVRFSLMPMSKPGAPEKIDERINVPARLLPSGQQTALYEQLKRQQQREKSPVAGVLFDTDYYLLQPKKISVENFWKDALAADDRVLSTVLGANR